MSEPRMIALTEHPAETVCELPVLTGRLGPDVGLGEPGLQRADRRAAVARLLADAVVDAWICDCNSSDVTNGHDPQPKHRSAQKRKFLKALPGHLLRR